MSILDFFISRRKNWPLSRRYFGSWGHISVAVAVAVAVIGVNVWTVRWDKKSGRCGKVALSGGSNVTYLPYITPLTTSILLY